MKILVVEPEKAPEVKEIDGNLESMQEVVGGYIEAIYPFDDPIAIVCNEEGKINVMTPNRVLVDKGGNVLDIICGTFFLCEALPTEENFTGLSDEEIERYMRKFRSTHFIGTTFEILKEGDSRCTKRFFMDSNHRV